MPVYSFSLRQYYEKCGTERAGYDVGLKLTSYPFLGTRVLTCCLAPKLQRDLIHTITTSTVEFGSGSHPEARAVSSIAQNSHP